MSIPPLNSLPPKFSLLSLQHSLRGFAPSSHTNFLLSLPPSFPRTHIRGRRRVASRIQEENRCGNHTPSRKGIVPTSVRRATVRTDLSMSLNCYLSRRRRHFYSQVCLGTIGHTIWQSGICYPSRRGIPSTPKYTLGHTGYTIWQSGICYSLILSSGR